MPHPLLSTISREASFIRRRRLLRVLLESALVFGIPAVILAGIDQAVTLREGTALNLVAGAGIVAVIYLLVRVIAVLRDLPNPKDVTMVVEKLCPDMMDSLICAVELLEQGREAESPFAAAVVKQVEDRLRQQRLRDATQNEAPGLPVLLGMAIVGAASMYVGHFSPLGHKARAHLGDSIAGSPSGVSVDPGNAEIAEGDSVVISARVKRGPDVAEIVVRDSTGDHLYHMIPQEDGTHRFEMFGVTEPFTYQILTPILDSTTHTITTFPKPSIKRAKVTITPPEYTGLPEETHEELRDVSAPIGSTVSVTLETNLPVTAELVPENSPTVSARARRPMEYKASMVVSKTTEYAIRLTDEHDRSITTDRTYLVESILDFAPIIQVQSPEDEGKAKIDDQVTFSALTTDDYGIALVEVVYSLNGGEWLNRKIYVHKANTPSQKELTPSWELDLNGIVKNGDVIYYYFRATDNAEPEANVKATDIRFLEIRPDADDPPEDDEEQDGEGEQQEGSVADLIREQKVLIRETFSMLHFAENEQRDEVTDALARKAGDLRVAAQKRYSAMLEKVPEGMTLGPIGDMFEEAINAMTLAERRMQGRLPDESLANQQKSLQKLIEMEIEMQKNAKKQKSKGKGQPQDQQQQQQKERDREREQLEKLEELNAQIEKVEDLARRQENLNQDMERAANKRDQQLQDYLEKRQEQLRQETAEMRDEMRGDPNLNQAAQEMARAADSQRQAADQMKKGQPTNATKQGEQAAQALDRSASMLQQMRDAMSGDKMQQAANKMQDLQNAQGELQGKTQGAAGKGQAGKQEAKDLKKQQQQLREQLQDLMESLNEATGELDKDNPQAATELAKGIQKAREENIEGNMKRAENALAYKKLDKAVEAQEQVKKSLEKLAESLQKARSQGPGSSPEQLSRMLQETMKSMQDIQEAQQGDQEQLSPSIQEAARQAQKHAQATGDQQMQENAQQLEDAASLGGFAGTPALVDGITAVLEANAKRLQQQLALAAMRRRLDLSRAAGQEAPDEYRKLVDEYFRKLSKEP